MEMIQAIWTPTFRRVISRSIQQDKKYMVGTMKDKSESRGQFKLRISKVLVGTELPARGFKAFFVARFSETFDTYGVSYFGKLTPGEVTGSGQVLSGYVTFAEGVEVVDVRVGVSFISVEQARRWAGKSGTN